MNTDIGVNQLKSSREQRTSQECNLSFIDKTPFWPSQVRMMDHSFSSDASLTHTDVQAVILFFIRIDVINLKLAECRKRGLILIENLGNCLKSSAFRSLNDEPH